MSFSIQVSEYRKQTNTHKLSTSSHPGKWRGTHRETILSISENRLSIKLSLARKGGKKRFYTGSIELFYIEINQIK